jgi:hypothetical protein
MAASNPTPACEQPRCAAPMPASPQTQNRPQPRGENCYRTFNRTTLNLFRLCGMLFSVNMNPQVQ